MMVGNGWNWLWIMSSGGGLVVVVLSCRLCDVLLVGEYDVTSDTWNHEFCVKTQLYFVSCPNFTKIIGA